MVASLAPAVKVLVMVVRLIRAVGQVIVLANAQIAAIAVIASSALTVAPVWVMQPSVRSVMRWSMLR